MKMQAIQKPVVILSFLACFSSCMRDELAVQPHKSGDVTVAGIDLDPTYKYQVYYDLKTSTVVGRNEKTIWDIGLEATASGYHVVMNGAKSMYAMATLKTDFSAVSAADSAGFAVGRKWDDHTGSLDSTAIGDWRTGKYVYVLDRGYDPAGIHQGWAKLQMLDVDDTSYRVRFAALDGTGEAIVTVKKDSAYNLAFVSFTTKEQVMVEPPKALWDLAFSQYTYVFYDQIPVTPYLVTGCLLNRNRTNAYLDTVNAFSAIDYSKVDAAKLKDDISVIGYDWKVYTSAGAYVIRPKNNYIIRDAEGVCYKLHFTGFYGASGTKGSPQWEHQRL